MFESIKRRSRESTLVSTSKTRAYTPAYQGRLGGLQYAAICCNTLQHVPSTTESQDPRKHSISAESWFVTIISFAFQSIKNSILLLLRTATSCSITRYPYNSWISTLMQSLYSLQRAAPWQSSYLHVNLESTLFFSRYALFCVKSSLILNQTRHSFDRINTIVKNKNLYIYKYDVSTGKWASSCDEINRALSWVKGALCPITLTAHLIEFNALLVW